VSHFCRFKGEITFKAKGIPIHQLLLKRQQQRQQQQQVSSSDQMIASRRFLNDVAFKALDFYRVLLTVTYQVLSLSSSFE
jgi:hypothetical protein